MSVGVRQDGLETAVRWILMIVPPVHARMGETVM